MSVECQCGRKTDVHLCADCQRDVEGWLSDLACGWTLTTSAGRTYQSESFIDYLSDARYGATRLGMSARRSTEHSAPMLAHLGKHGDFKGSPAELHDDLHALLTHWVGVVNTGTETLAVDAEAS